MRILIADDHILIRAGLKQLIESLGDYEVVGEASTGSSTVRHIEDDLPDVLLLDISMPDGNGLDILKEIRRRWPELKILMLSMHSDMAHVKTALANGANGFLVKDSAPAELGLALDTVMRDQTFLSPRVSESVVGALVGQNGQDSEYDKLSPRQQQILDLMAEGYATKEIANHLDLSVKTVETHRSRMMETLGLNRGQELLRFALKHHRSTVSSGL